MRQYHPRFRPEDKSRGQKDTQDLAATVDFGRSLYELKLKMGPAA
jgi:hypothetical protein